MMRLSLGYPSPKDEIEMVRRRQNGLSLDSVRQIVSREEILRAKDEVASVYVKDEMIEYIVSLCNATRHDPRVLQGASPRASLALTALAKATAWIQGRDYILPRDVRYVFNDCVAHRLIWATDAGSDAIRQTALSGFLEAVKAPDIK